MGRRGKQGKEDPASRDDASRVRGLLLLLLSFPSLDAIRLTAFNDSLLLQRVCCISQRLLAPMSCP